MGDLAAASPAHALLREHTRDAHDAAEATPGMHRLLAGALDEGGYRRLLAAQGALFDAWERERADDIAAIATLWPYVSRATLVGADLSATPSDQPKAMPEPKAMSEPTAMSQPKAPPQPAAPATPSPAFWGELYVIEGSALGGRVIVRRLRELFPALPHAYYAVGETAPGQWRRFQQVLDQALPDDDSQRLAILAAQRMFARFQRTLQDPDSHG